MDLSFEQEVIHNPVLGSLALWQFCREYAEQGSEGGAPLPKMMLVLPVVFNRRSMCCIRRMQKKSGLLKALAEHPDLVLSLQERVEWFSDLTFSSLRLACLASLIHVDRTQEWPAYACKRKTIPIELEPVANDVKGIVAAAKRLGAWFSKEDIASLCRLLKVNF